MDGCVKRVDPSEQFGSPGGFTHAAAAALIIREHVISNRYLYRNPSPPPYC